MIIPIMKVACSIVIVMTQHQRYWKEKMFFPTTKPIDIMMRQKGLISFSVVVLTVYLLQTYSITSSAT